MRGLCVAVLVLIGTLKSNLVSAESCGGIGTHVRMQVGDCADDVPGCQVPHSTELRLQEDFILSQNSATARLILRFQSSAGVTDVLDANYDNLTGGQLYSFSQGIILSNVLAGRAGTVILQIYDVATDNLEICSVMPVYILG